MFITSWNVLVQKTSKQSKGHHGLILKTEVDDNDDDDDRKNIPANLQQMVMKTFYFLVRAKLKLINYITNRYWLDNTDKWCRCPTNNEADDDGDHRLYDIHLCARQLVMLSCSSSRLLLNLSSVWITWRGRHRNVLTTTSVTSDHLALTSDDVKYATIAVDKDADWKSVVPHEIEHRIRLSFPDYNDDIQFLNSRFNPNTAVQW